MSTNSNDIFDPDRPTEPGQRLFRDSVQFPDAVKVDVPKSVAMLQDNLHVTQAQAATMVDGHVKLLVGAINPLDGPAVLRTITQYVAKPATDEERKNWSADAHKKIRETYGADTDKLMANARTMVKRRPALEKLLNETGLGDHPVVVKALIDNVRRRMRRYAL